MHELYVEHAEAAIALGGALEPWVLSSEGAGGEMWYEARHIGAGRAA